MRSLVHLPLMLVALAGCAGGGGAPASGAPTTASQDTAPTPYTAEEIRLASPAGRRIEHRVEAAGKPPVVRVMSFSKVDDQGADFESVTLDETGHLVGDKHTGHATWEELRAHAAFPRASVVVANETITVPAGTFECMAYTVSRGEAVTTLWFAKTLPGPPVRMTVSASGKVIETRTLVRHLAR